MTLHVTNPRLTFETLRCDVLVIEDEALVMALLKRYLTGFIQTSYSKKLVGSPESLNIKTLESGWDLLQADLSQVKVAIVDILLPQVTGVDLIRDFRRRFPQLGIIPISGMATEPMKRTLKECLPEGMGLLPKPLRKEDFFDAFVKAWNFAHHQQHQPQSPVPTQEAGEELWTAVRAVPQTGLVVPVERRGLLRKKQAA